MSGTNSCKCGEHKKPAWERKWVVRDYKCNYSAFSGYHKTPSDYSLIECEVCSTMWRTKAKYVYDLRYESRRQ